MKRLTSILAAWLVTSMTTAAEPLPKPWITGLKNPESVVVTNDGRTFISIIGEFDKDGDGSIVEVKDGKAEPFAEGMDDPKGLTAFQDWLYVTDKTRIRRVNLKTGKAEIYVDTKDFPHTPIFLNDIVADELGNFYVSDSGKDKSGGAIFKIATKIPPKGKKPIEKKVGTPPKVTLIADGKKDDFIKTPNGLLMDSLYHLLILDFATGDLNRLRLSDGVVEKVAEGFLGGDGLAFDGHGQLFITSWSQGKLWGIPRPGEKAILLAEGLKSAADLCLDARNNKQMLVPDMLTGTITAFSTQIPGWEVDDTPLPLETTLAFGDLKWSGWDGGESTGKIVPLRPLVLTHANDGSHRTFVATQQGVIHAIPEGAKESKVFLDIQKKVYYNDNENEQGLLGMTFHPKFKENGELFVFYTVKEPKLTNVVSRFRLSKDDPTKADPASEEELFRINHKYWNHDGGTICFGPDGFMYVVLGDGGSGDDPDDHGQRLDVLLGKILRIDVDHKDGQKAYSIPKDNPFVGQKDAQPEIFAYGLRNPWRMSFDRKTGQGWLGDVGQNLWEEINLLQKGGNYGWRRRESQHPFWVEGTGPKKEYIEPIWEYNHDVGKSITGGHVYRGSKVPALDGMYLYADYVTNKLWALKYDEKQGRVVANRSIAGPGLPIYSYGEDEKGEVYWMTASPTGRGIYTFAK